ncbi:MAG: histidine phosphatase family protein [Pseudomonadota bacterium]
MTLLLIIRHGNTFDKGDVITRVGNKTDLPLSVSGRKQAGRLGKYLLKNYPDIQNIYTSNLKRTIETAEISLADFPVNINQSALKELDEIDYGVDENQPEENVVERIGQNAIDLWNKELILPDGWHLDIELVKKTWLDIAQNAFIKNENTAVFTSNGIARFSPYILPDVEIFCKNYDLKMKTAAVSCFEHKNNAWQAKYWNYSDF